MSILSMVYLAILVVAIGVTVWMRVQIVVPARPKWFWRLLYLAAAAMVAGVTLASTRDLNAAVSGYFIAGMFLVFAFWQGGLTKTGVVNKLGSIRQYPTLSAIQLVPENGGCQLRAMVGSLVIVRLRFAQTPEAVAAFLKTKMAPERVVIVH